MPRMIPVDELLKDSRPAQKEEAGDAGTRSFRTPEELLESYMALALVLRPGAAAVVTARQIRRLAAGAAEMPDVQTPDAPASPSRPAQSQASDLASLTDSLGEEPDSSRVSPEEPPARHQSLRRRSPADQDEDLLGELEARIAQSSLLVGD